MIGLELLNTGKNVLEREKTLCLTFRQMMQDIGKRSSVDSGGRLHHRKLLDAIVSQAEAYGRSPTGGSYQCNNARNPFRATNDPDSPSIKELRSTTDYKTAPPT